MSRNTIIALLALVPIVACAPAKDRGADDAEKYTSEENERYGRGLTPSQGRWQETIRPRPAGR